MSQQLFIHPPPRDWNQIVLSGHFDHDDVLLITNRLHEWLSNQQVIASISTIGEASDDDELICCITIQFGAVSAEAVAAFIESLHAHPKITFVRGRT